MNNSFSTCIFYTTLRSLRSHRSRQKVRFLGPRVFSFRRPLGTFGASSACTITPLGRPGTPWGRQKSIFFDFFRAYFLNVPVQAQRARQSTRERRSARKSATCRHASAARISRKPPKLAPGSTRARLVYCGTRASAAGPGGPHCLPWTAQRGEIGFLPGPALTEPLWSPRASARARMCATCELFKGTSEPL